MRCNLDVFDSHDHVYFAAIPLDDQKFDFIVFIIQFKRIKSDVMSFMSFTSRNRVNMYYLK